MLKEGLEGISGGSSVATDEYVAPQDAELELREPEHERAHGEYETVKLYSDEFIKLSQIRGTKNAISAELKESIRSNGLINPIDVARMSRETLAEYISFTNETWGASARIEDFDAMIREDGSYYVVIAGHSRHEGIVELENDAEDPMPRRRIMAKVHEVIDPAGIIELQHAENISSVPPQERVAIALVETYNWGVRHGKWSSRKEFLKQRADMGVTSKTLDYALSFQDMPKSARNFVLSGKVKYMVGVELGASVKVLRDFMAVQAGFTGSDDPRIGFSDEVTKRLDEMVAAQVNEKVNDCINKKLNSTAGKKLIVSWRGRMREKLANLRGEEVPTLPIQMVKPEEVLAAKQKELHRHLVQQVNSFSLYPAAHYKEVIELNREVIGDEATDAALETMGRSIKRTLTELGDTAMQSPDYYDENQYAFDVA